MTEFKTVCKLTSPIKNSHKFDSFHQPGFYCSIILYSDCWITELLTLCHHRILFAKPWELLKWSLLLQQRNISSLLVASLSLSLNFTSSQLIAHKIKKGKWTNSLLWIQITSFLVASVFQGSMHCYDINDHIAFIEDLFRSCDDKHLIYVLPDEKLQCWWRRKMRLR